MYSRHDYSTKMSIYDYTHLFALCDYLQAPDQTAAFVRALKRTFDAGCQWPLDPWEVFKLAAQLDNIEIARLAAARLQEDNRSLTHLLFANPPSFFDGVPPKYVYALVRSSVYHGATRNSSGRIGGAWFEQSPSEIAKNFKLE